MSLPTEILDQLLSGYLDDVLSVDERTRVEQLLKNDPEVQARLEQLKEMSASLKEIDQLEQRGLDDGFADRVLKAAVDQATSEGLNEEHPVMMLARQPSVPQVAVADRSSMIWKVVGGLTALAASIVVAVVVLQTPNDNNIADVNPADPNTDVIAESPTTDTDPDAVIDPTRSIDTPESVEKIASTPNDKTNVGAPNIDEPKVGPVAPIGTEGPADPKVDPASKIASQSPKSNVPKDNPIDNNVITNGFVMVLNVTLSDVGNMEDAIGIALKDAKIDAVQTRQIDSKIVTFKKKVGEGLEGAKVLYLEGSAKKLDYFSHRLYLDRKGVKSIEYHMSFGTPVSKFANSLKKIDATKIQHVSAWELADDGSGSVDKIVNKLSGLNYSSADRDNPKAGLALGPDGEDFRTHMIVVVQ